MTYRRSATRAIALIAVCSLTACAGTTSRHGADHSAVTASLCGGDFQKAESLAAEQLKSHGWDAQLRLLHAYAIEKSGMAMKARPLYDRLVRAGHSDAAMLTCGSKTLLVGTISDAAADRLRTINVALAAHGATKEQVMSMSALGPSAWRRPASDRLKNRFSIGAHVSETIEAAAKDPKGSPRSADPENRVQMADAGGRNHALPGVKGWSETTGGKTVAMARAHGNNGYWIHLASYRSRTRAARGWRELHGLHPEALGACSMHVVEANPIPGQGVFYRMGCRGFASLADSTQACRRIKQGGQYCVPRKVHE